MKMNIDNFESLKEWLCRTLKPICDADPMALAKYVLALVKKDKSERDLKSLCIDQLEVFLQKETLGFVDKLFEALTNKSYLLTPELPPTGARKVEFCPHPVKDVKKEETKPVPEVFGTDIQNQIALEETTDPSPPSLTKALEEKV